MHLFLSEAFDLRLQSQTIIILKVKLYNYQQYNLDQENKYFNTQFPQQQNVASYNGKNLVSSLYMEIQGLTNNSN